jgi:post-segregation antitoxin (ccd killing protein)
VRTTITIQDDLLDRAKRVALERGETVSDVVQRALVKELAQRPAKAARPTLAVFRGRGGVMPGVDLTSNAALADLLDDGIPVDQRR